VIRLTVEYARRWFDEHPDIDSFSLGMDDISHLCSCADCRALDPHPDSYERREFSDRHYKFVNAVARQVAATHPDRYIGTLIYDVARRPPETVPVLEDNVFGFITETSALWFGEDRRQADHEITREWARRCRHLSRYDYYGFACVTPRYYPHHVAEQIKFDKSVGLEGMYIEVYTFLPVTAPMIWATAKLQWDHRRGIDALLDEFCAKLFGGAGPTMRLYWDVLEHAYNSPVEPHGWEHRSLQAQAVAVSARAVDEGARLLEAAARLAPDEVVRRRIDIVRGGLQYGSYVVYTHDLSRQLAATSVTDRETAEKALELTERLVALGAERERYWAEAAGRDDLLGANLRGLSDMGYLATGQARTLEQGGLAAAMRVLGWYARHAPAELAEVAARLEGTAGPLAEAVQAWRHVAEKAPPNLVANGAFEDLSANETAPEMDWSTTTAPRGWSTWSRTPLARFAVLAGEGQEGHAAAITDAESACFLQTIPVEPGQRYLCTAWARSTPPHAGGTPRLAIRLRTPTGAWHPRRELEPSLDAGRDQADWQPLVLVLTVPEGAGSLVVMLSAADQPAGGRILFDNVCLNRLPDSQP
jgi:hypothetical protein